MVTSSMDVSTILNGYYSDASRMFIIGQTSPEKEKLVRVTKECLDLGQSRQTIQDLLATLATPFKTC